MFEIIFHMIFALVVLSGIVYFPIFFWLKKQQENKITCCDLNPLKYGLKMNQLKSLR